MGKNVDKVQKSASIFSFFTGGKKQKEEDVNLEFVQTLSEESSRTLNEDDYEMLNALEIAQDEYFL